MSRKALKEAKAFAVGALSDLNLGAAYDAKLVVWLHAIANGGKVVEHEHRENARQYVPAITAVKAEVHFTEEYERRHEVVVYAFVSLLFQHRKKGQWKIVPAPDPEEEKKKEEEERVFVIDRQEDVRVFLLSVRRVPPG